MTWISDAAIHRLRQAADSPDLSGTKYELIEAIGRGGMGTVYRAHDRELGRDVALKVINVPEIDAGTAHRLALEARVLARLEHPGVVPVHDVGQLPDGRTFYAMKLVRGRRLDEDGPRGGSLADRLRIFERICDAVAFAHAHAVIHRDLKPENVMVGPFGEVLVMDWGLAKILSERGRPGATIVPPADPAQAPQAGASTAHGTILGTQGYMAPEQAQGDVGQVDERTDVFALGGILYFLLTREPPPSIVESNGSAQPKAPDRLRRLQPAVPRPLQAICLKALSPDPAARYRQVLELSGDIARFLDGLAVLAYPEAPWERAARFGRKYRTAIILVFAYLLMRVLLLVYGGT